MKFLLYSLLAILFLPYASMSQFGWYPQPFNETLTKIYFFDQDNGFLLTNKNVIYKTTDKGNNWTKITHNHIMFRSIGFSSQSKGYAVSTTDIFLTTDGGYNWTKVELEKQKHHAVHEVFVVDSLVAYVSGSTSDTTVYTDFCFFKTEDGGANWERIIHSKNTYAEDMFFSEKNNGWVIAYMGYMLYHTDDGGYHLDSLFSTFDQPNNYMRYIAFNDFLNGWLLCSFNLYSTSNRGNQWVRKDIPDASYYSSMYFLDKNVGYVSANISGKASIYKTTDGGNNWEKQNIQDLGRSIFPHSLTFIDSKRGFALNGNLLFRTTTGGADTTSFEATITAQNGTDACVGDTITLEAFPQGNNFSYQWSTGETTPSIKVASTGGYSVYIKREDASANMAELSVYFSPLPEPAITGDSAVCPGESAFLTSFNEHFAYLWSNGETTRTIEITQPGNYTLIVENQYGCSNSTSFDVTHRKVKLLGDLTVEFDSVFIGEKKILQVTLTNNEPSAVNILSAEFINFSNHFKIINSDIFPATLFSSEKLILEIEFSPTTETQYICSLVLQILSPCEGTFEVVLSGYGKKPVSVVEAKGKFMLSPNPADSYLRISKDNYIGNVVVYNALGEPIIDAKIDEIVDISHLPSGIYFVKIDGEIKSFVKK